MAEREAEQPAELPNPEQQAEGSDNESSISNEPDNTQELTRLETELKDEMGSIASQVKETVLGMKQQIEKKFLELNRQINNIEMHLRDHNNNQGISQIRNSTPLQINTISDMQTSNIPISQSENPVVSQMAPSRVEFNLHGTNSNTTSASALQARADNYGLTNKRQEVSRSDKKRQEHILMLFCHLNVIF